MNACDQRWGFDGLMAFAVGEICVDGLLIELRRERAPRPKRYLGSVAIKYVMWRWGGKRQSAGIAGFVASPGSKQRQSTDYGLGDA